jgi:Phospholipase_D-nuclease N-terminal/Short C-terminal domain
MTPTRQRPARRRDGRKEQAMTTFAADYPFFDIFWSMVIFFAWVAYIWLMIVIFGDIFRRRDIGGWAKAAWCVFMIVLPFIGVLAYLIAQHDGMTERNMEAARVSQRQFDDQVRAAVATNGGSGPASEIEKAEKLRAKGAITDAEFERIKDRALAVH